MNSYTYLASAEYEATLYRPLYSKFIQVTIFWYGMEVSSFQVAAEQEAINTISRQFSKIYPPSLKKQLLWELDQHAAAWEQRAELAKFASSGSAFPFDRVTTVAAVVGLLCLLSVLFFFW